MSVVGSRRSAVSFQPDWSRISNDGLGQNSWGSAYRCTLGNSAPADNHNIQEFRPGKISPCPSTAAPVGKSAGSGVKRRTLSGSAEFHQRCRGRQTALSRKLRPRCWPTPGTSGLIRSTGGSSRQPTALLAGAWRMRAASTAMPATIANTPAIGRMPNNRLATPATINAAGAKRRN
jgi:hypothetical protein